jgi:RNA 2',3'-cyclic 3'-phosphodiesterase
MTMKRLFIAIPVNAEPPLLDALSVLKLELQDENINWVSPPNLHFTLQFLGDTPPANIPELNIKLKRLTEGFSQAAGIIKGIDTFGQGGVPRVIFARLEEMPAMGEMAMAIREVLEPLGYRPDYREFKSHLTLGRIRYLRNRKRLMRVIDLFRDKELQKMTTREIILFESILKPQGPVYKPLYTYTLPTEQGV